MSQRCCANVGSSGAGIAARPRRRLSHNTRILVCALSSLLLASRSSACEQCAANEAAELADTAVEECTNVWDECDDPMTPYVEACDGDPPEMLCGALAEARMCELTFSEALPKAAGDEVEVPYGYSEQRVWRHCPLACVRCKRHDAEHHRLRGVELEQAGKLEEAEAAYRDALGVLPHEPHLHRHLGALLSAVGHSEAQECFSEAARLEREGPPPPVVLPPAPPPHSPQPDSPGTLPSSLPPELRRPPPLPPESAEEELELANL